MQALTLPFFDRLKRAGRVLLAGAGGGFDIFCGLPLYFALREAGTPVFLANLSFSFLPPIGPARLAPAVMEVTPDTINVSDYFPEFYLAQWFRTQGEAVPIYCFERTGVQPLLTAYRALVAQLDIDTVILVDGGTDSLMRGNESGLGTPHEDIASIVAVSELAVEQRMLVCLGFGVDHFHGVCHTDFLRAVAELSRRGGYLGMFSLLEEMEPVQRYRAACAAVFAAMPDATSIVSSSILAALAGQYGNYHSTPRTAGSALWINPLMSAYWCFDLTHVAERILYREALLTTDDYMDVRRVIGQARQGMQILPRTSIPL